MTDQERNLRSRLRAADLPPAPVTLHMALDRIAAGETPTGGRTGRGRTIVLLAAAALMVLGGAAIGAGGILDGRVDSGPPPSDGNPVVAVSPRPAATPGDPAASSEPSFAVPSPDAPCATETAQVLAGDAMPPAAAEPATIAPGSSARGAYVTHPKGGGYVPAEVWAADADGFRRIAWIWGSMNVIEVTDVSPDGGSVLVTLGRLSPRGINPECSDVYLLESDASRAIRLTEHGPGQRAHTAKFSSDGRFVAFSRFAAPPPDDVGSSVVVWDRATGSTREYACSAALIAWAPTQPRVAAYCDNAVVIVDAITGEAEATQVDERSPLATDGPWALAWPSPGSIFLASDEVGWSGGMALTELTLAGSSLSGTFGPPEEIALTAEPVAGTLSMNPGSRDLLVQVDTAPAGVDPQDAWGFGLDRAGASAPPVHVLETGVVEATWSDAGDGFVVLIARDGTRRYEVHDLTSGRVDVLATLPAGTQSSILRTSGTR